MSIVMENYDYTKKMILEDANSKVLEPGDSLYLIKKARPASLSVKVETEAYYMVSASQATTEKMMNGEATFIAADSIDFAETEDFSISFAGGILIENRSDSIGNIEVDWRI